MNIIHIYQQNIDVLSAINDALSPLAEFTDVISGEQYVTISAVLPIVNLLNTSVLKVIRSDQVCGDFRATMTLEHHRPQ